MLVFFEIISVSAIGVIAAWHIQYYLMLKRINKLNKFSYLRYFFTLLALLLLVGLIGEMKINGYSNLSAYMRAGITIVLFIVSTLFFNKKYAKNT